MSQRAQAAGVSDAMSAAADADGSGLDALAMVQRLIFNTDATVVRILENCFDELIRTDGLTQEITKKANAIDLDLELVGGESVLRRSTLLQGCRTGRNYIYAESEIVLERLPPSLQEGLIETAEPIGRLLIRGRIETFRELLRSGRALAGSRGPALGAGTAEMLPFRTYRVIVGGRPVMRITEHFAPVFLTSRPETDAFAAPVSAAGP
jgi:chorismate-pyruvate lyase